ncbi:hypothetical protein CHS0354_013517 [Potamilus streckersoni]|uniref:Uncharacterized protein n=1 Tax=Potamilus streckersoni TaxID=2493646 RepID=A0AAE0T9B9_9BIVA|nr:hypothetical protein CHS0354_013517 [Potamilus streckersoni]
MLNAGHTQIGCAYRSPCSHQDDDAFVCLYTGGVMEIPFFKAGLPCTRCDGLSSFCDDGLCAPCVGEAEYCDCRKTCHKENVGEGILDNSTCTCQCQYGLGPNCDEECKNPEMYENWDICADIAADLCISPDLETRDMFRHFCPEQCTCRKYPQEGTHKDKLDVQDETHQPTVETSFFEEDTEKYPELK